MKTTIGAGVERKDGVAKVTGKALYPADRTVPRMAYAAVVLSTIPAGTITAIDDRKARAVPGFVGIVSAMNAPKLQELGDMPDGEYGERILPFQDRQVYFRGQAVAVVVAETWEQARYAANLVEVSYQAGPFAIEMEKSTNVYRPEKYNNRIEVQLKRGDFETARKTAAMVVEETYRTPYMNHNPLEPHAALAQWEGDKLTIFETTQGVTGMQAVLAKIFSVPHENVHVISPFVGGGFGCKGFVWPYTIMSSVAARALGRPVNLPIRREEMFTLVGHRGPTRQEIFLGAGADGKLVALKHATFTHSSMKGEHFESCGVVTSILYACPNADISHDVARVNTGSPTPMRAPGEAPGTFALEMAMDELAEKLKMDPVEFRIKNHADEDPQKHKPWTSKHLIECYRRGGELFGWSKRNPTPRSMKAENDLLGWGMATAVYPANKRSAKAKVLVRDDGTALVRCATQDIGTGTYTTLAQIAADVLGLPITAVRAEIGDSALPKAGVSGGSSTSASAGPAVYAAAQDARKKLVQLATQDQQSSLHGQDMAQIEATDGQLILKGDPSQKDEYKEILRRASQSQIEGEGDEEVAKDAEEKSPHTAYSFGAHFVEVRVHPLTKHIRVTRVVTVIDAGRILNAMTARSQIQGGVVWGIGMALLEETELDPRNGTIVNPSLSEYLVPVNPDIPELTVEFVEEPDLAFNSLGVRGIGEIGITGVTAAIANAVYHATGVRVRDLPIRLDKVIGEV